MKLPVVIPAWVKTAAIFLVTAAALWGATHFYKAHAAILQARFDEGFKAGQSACETLHSKAIAQDREDQIAKAADKLKQQQSQGAVAEQRRSEIDAHFANLEATLRAAQRKGANDETTTTPGCTTYVLPPERLRLWETANHGYSSETRAALGAASVEPIGSATPIAPASQRTDRGSGDQPSAGRAPIPPVGDADVRPAAVSAGGSTRLQPLGAQGD